MSNNNPRDEEGPHLLFRIRFLGVHLELFAGLSLPIAKGLVPFFRRVAGLPEWPLKTMTIPAQIAGEQVDVRAGLSPDVQSVGKDVTKPL